MCRSIIWCSSLRKKRLLKVLHSPFGVKHKNLQISYYNSSSVCFCVCVFVCSLSPPRSFGRCSPNLVGVCRWTSHLPLRCSFSKRSTGRWVNGSLSLSTILGNLPVERGKDAVCFLQRCGVSLESSYAVCFLQRGGVSLVSSAIIYNIVKVKVTR